MSNILVRGIPLKIKRQIQKMAEAKNLSLNQAMIELIAQGISLLEKDKQKKEDWDQAFREVEILREQIREKYGKQEDSVKIIRELRDSR